VTTIAVSSLDHEILASEGSTVTINCTVNSTEGLIWEYLAFWLVYVMFIYSSGYILGVVE
jgi:hypothetical protein